MVHFCNLFTKFTYLLILLKNKNNIYQSYGKKNHNFVYFVSSEQLLITTVIEAKNEIQSGELIKTSVANIDPSSTGKLSYSM